MVVHPSDTQGDTPDSLGKRVDEACDRFEADWMAGARPRIEDVLDPLAPADRGEFLRELLLIEAAYRREFGATPTAAEYKARFPEYGPVVEAAFGRLNAGSSWNRTDPITVTLTLEPKTYPLTSPALRHTHLTLTVQAGPHEGRAFRFDDRENVIVGRDRIAHLQLSLEDQEVSRAHFLIEFHPPYCRLMDLGSRNGTTVNGDRVLRADLKDGDVIQVGKTVLLVTIADAGTSSTPPPTLPDLSPKIEPAAPLPMTWKSSERPFCNPLPSAPLLPHEPSIAPSRFSCLACNDPVDPGNEAQNAPLCPACRVRIRSSPQPIHGYLLIRKLGQGAMGVVHLAIRGDDGLPVALKAIIPDVAATGHDIARFLREASILCQLDHAHIVRFLDLGESNRRLYLAMEYVPGSDAARLVKQGGAPLAIQRAAGIVSQLLEALEYAHAQRFVHRDIKPANLLVANRDGRDVVKLADFGLARIYQSSRISGLTMTGDIGGTPPFLPPEQILRYRDASSLSDIYATGATLYYLLTGHYVYDLPARSALGILKILEDDPVPIQVRRDDIPAGLAAIIEQSLARQPTSRFQNARAMFEALAPFR